MNRNSLVETAGRVMHMATRFTINKGNANPMLQTLFIDLMNSEGRKRVEHFQAFGFTATPLPRDEQKEGSSGGDKGGAGGGGGGGGGADGGLGKGEEPKGPAAEGIALFVGGQRNHPVVIAMDDRRHRPMGLKPGENAQYDDQGQMTLLRRDGLYLVSLDDEGDGTAPAAVMLRDAEGKATGQSEKKERMVSLRHVTKKKQERKLGGAGDKESGGGGAAPAAMAAAAAEEEKKKSDYKHEGETVNTEVRATKSKIGYYDGDKSVGHYDKGNKDWLHHEGSGVEKSTRIDKNHAHQRFGSNHIWVNNANCFSSKPLIIQPDDCS